MKKHIIFSLSLAGFFSFALIPSCNVNEITSSRKCINPPFEHASKDFITMEVNAEKGKNIHLPNGTRIIIPPNAFTDGYNKTVKGNVSLKYREFHDAADLILSGIPMSYDSAGTKINFQTAGMFEIAGFHNNEPVFISQGKSIEVKMGSHEGENNYNFYYLDTLSQNWSYVGKNTPAANEEKARLLDEKIGTPVSKPIEPQAYDPNSFVFDMDINTNEYPELKDFQNIIWQYAGNNDASDPEKNEWVFSEKWTNISLNRDEADNAVYYINLKNSENNYKTRVKPVIAGKNLESAKKKFREKLEKYESYVQAKVAEEQRLANQANFLRSFQISSFGVYNWDRAYKNPDAIKIAADFNFDGPVDKGNVTIFLVANKTAIVKYPKNDWERFSYLPSEKNIIVAVMPGDKVAVFKNFGEVNPDSDTQKYTFHLKTVDKKIKSSEDLKSILELI